MHVPVLMKEVLEYLQPKPNQNFVDCTLGDGGHATEILEHIAPDGKLLGIDADAEAIENVKLKMQNKKLLSRMDLVNDNFRNLGAVIKEQKFGPVHGILLDLGFSSSTLMRGRGFSFEKDELLDMRFDTAQGVRAAEIVNGWNQTQLEKLLSEYGQERLARQIADKIVAERKKKSIVTTAQLAEVVVEAYRDKVFRKPSPQPSPKGRGGLNTVPSPRGRGKCEGRIPWIGGLHPATRTFQALRIEVNDELNALQEILPQAMEVLAPSGRLAVIAFHSLEDRIVKQFFKGYSDGKIKVLTKKPVVPSDAEIKNNSRARSAKMRVIEKL